MSFIPLEIEPLVSTIRRNAMPSDVEHRLTTPASAKSSDDDNSASIAGCSDRQHGVGWEKALWRKQPFEDNYVPPTFLAELDALRMYPIYTPYNT